MVVKGFLGEILTLNINLAILRNINEEFLCRSIRFSNITQSDS